MNDATDTPAGTSSDPVEALLRRVAAEQIADAPAPRGWSTLSDRRVDARDSNRRPIVLAIAASLIAVLIGGLVLVTRHGDDEVPAAPPTSPTTSPPMLSEVGLLSDDAWVVLGLLPEGDEYTYAMRNGEERTVNYGDRTDPEQHRISIVRRELDTGADQVLAVDGRDWYVEEDPTGWSAMAVVGDRVVQVLGNREFFEGAGGDVIRNLRVVSTADLPFPPLDPEGPMTPVAGFEADGFDVEMRANGSNGYFCTALVEGEGSSVGCGQPVDVSGPIANVVTSGSVSTLYGVTTTRFLLGGIASPDVATVEVELVDGRTVSAVPTDSSGTFDVRFWVVGGEVDLTAPGGSEAATSELEDLIVDIRSLDADGTLLTTSIPWVATG